MGATKRILILAFSFCLCIQLYAQQPVEKTLVKSFNLQGNDVIDLALEGDIQINEWNSNVIRVEMLITLQNGNEMLLKSLIKAGRYNLKSSETEDSESIFAKQRKPLSKSRIKSSQGSTKHTFYRSHVFFRHNR